MIPARRSGSRLRELGGFVKTAETGGTYHQELMQLRSQSCGPQALCTQSSLPHAQGLAALSRLQGQQPATALAPRTASGCEPCTEGALRSARGLRLFCSAGKGAGKTSRNSSLVSTAKTDLITIKGVGPVNEALLVNRGVDSVKALVNTYHQQANANTHELIKFLQVGPRRP